MGIFLRHTYNIKPVRWGSDADVMYAVRDNCEKIYGIDSNRQALAMPFWEGSGLTARDFSLSQKNGTLTGSTIRWKNSGIEITGDGVSDRVNLGSITSSDLLSGAINKQLSIVTRVYRTGNPPNNDSPRIIDKSTSGNGFGGWALFWDDAAVSTRFYFVIANGTGFVISSNYGSSNAFYDIVLTAKEGELNLYINGRKDVASVDQVFTWPTLTANCAIGNWNHAVDRQWNGKIFSMNAYDDILTHPQVALFRDLPYGLYQKVSRPFYSWPRLRQYILSADAGSFQTTGTNVSLLTGNVLSAGAGSFNITGQDVTLTYTQGYALIAGSESYTLTGNALDLLYGYRLDTESGSFEISGQNISFLKNFKLSVEPSIYSITGQSASLIKGFILGLESGTHSLTGQDIVMFVGYSIIVNNGVYELTGSLIDLLYRYIVDAGSGGYNILGDEANLLKGHIIYADSESFGITGKDINFIRALRVDIDSGIYDIAGQNIILTYNGIIIGGCLKIVFSSNQPKMVFNSNQPTIVFADLC